jgi:hypothetical protein
MNGESSERTNPILSHIVFLRVLLMRFLTLNAISLSCADNLASKQLRLPFYFAVKGICHNSGSKIK